MSTGTVEKLLVQRYGQPTIYPKGTLFEVHWSEQLPAISSVMYKGIDWTEEMDANFFDLKIIYGGLTGGFLIGDSLKIATLPSCKIYGLYTINELQRRQEVRQALSIDQDVKYFMDAANVWYYGYKSGQLIVYDVEMQEWDSLGPFEKAFDELLVEWESVVLERVSGDATT